MASFIGSLQLGPVNLYVINSTLNSGKKTALYAGIGGCIPEFVYCTLAVFSSELFIKYTFLFVLFKIAFVIILITLSIFYFLKTNTQVKSINAQLKKENNLKSLFKGLSLGLFNPQLLPFWLFIQLYFNSISFLQIQSNLQKIAYIVGAGVGAFLLLLLLIKLTIKYQNQIMSRVNYNKFNKVISLLFFIMALHQLYNLINLHE